MARADDDCVLILLRGTSGVRPSSGTGAWCERGAQEFSGHSVRVAVAAPEDGRTPSKTSNVRGYDSFGVRHLLVMPLEQVVAKIVLEIAPDGVDVIGVVLRVVVFEQERGALHA